VFVKELDEKWYYRGDFKIVAQSADANEIRLREQQAKRTDVYKIIFLQEVAQ
jgi:peptidyl-tRNA hydrolase